MTALRSDPHPQSRDRARLDVICRDVIDAQTGSVTRLCTPDPRRYERVERAGHSGWLDRFDGMLLTDELVEQIFRSTPQVPMYVERQEIDDAFVYVEGRRQAIRQRLASEATPQQGGHLSSDILEQLAGRTHGFVVLAFDIVGSTRLALDLPVRDFARLCGVVLFEAGETVIQFHGQVLKNGGDGVIAYFAEPSFNRKHDLALDCALTLRHLVHAVLNDELERAGLPRIDVRLGLEAGEAIVDTQGSPSTNASVDLAGAVVNMAVKVQALAAPGEILVGRAADLGLHTDWREQLEPVDLPPTWTYRNRRGAPYEVYRYTGRHDRVRRRIAETTGEHTSAAPL